ncbi:hypothetical protein RND81_02G167700 [Saponaria officinalis]|uniref:Tetratricopeptide SHNi-TPR domain-containing protein n=1 Tax=Saponaria officinalis TaxID=3572 RepID=A0AAW1MV64_SAPOF
MADNGITPDNAGKSEMTNEAAIDSIAPSNSESSVKIPETSDVSAADDDENSLQFSDELMEKGNVALKEGDYSEASELFSRALEIRVAHHGELAPECVKSYYKFGIALLSKAQEESDPLGAMPKKDAESKQVSVQNESVKSTVDRTSSLASVSSNIEQCSSSNQAQGTEDVPSKLEENKDDESDMEEPGEDEEDESDLDLAWKMLDLARAISEKHSEETLDMVDILSVLAEVSLEREDIETSLSDYQKALSILERLVESDSRRIAELNFRICLCLEVGSKAEEAIPYCQKALSVCKSRLQRLTDDLKSTLASTTTSAASETVQVEGDSSVASQANDSVSITQAEIETLMSLSGDLEKKLEDLQQLVSNPSSILSDILGLMVAKARTNEQAVASAGASSSRMGVATNNGDFDSATVSTAHTSGTPEVTHLGVVGRGVKRMVLTPTGVEPSSAKRPALDPKPDTDGNPAA